MYYCSLPYFTQSVYTEDKVMGRPYFYCPKSLLLLYWHLKLLLSRLVMMTKKYGRPLTFVTILTTHVCMLFGTPSLLSFQFLVIFFYTCIV